MNTASKTYQKEVEANSSITTGNIFKVVLSVTIPILLYTLLNYAYEIYDTLMISVSGSGSVEVIVMVNQIKKTVVTLGMALVSGGLIFIAQKMGQKQSGEANKALTSVFYSLAILSTVLVFVLIPFAPAFLTLLGTPTDIVGSATGYFSVQLLCMVLEMFNSLFIGVQRVKGRTPVVLYLNIGVVFIKVLLTTFIVYGNVIPASETTIAVATFLAQLFLFTFAIIHLFRKNSILSVSKPTIQKTILKPIVLLSFPIFIGNFLFNFSKVFINAQTAQFYGSSVLMAVGISSIVTSLNMAFLTSISSASSTIISQNYGAKKHDRVFKTFEISLLVMLVITAINFNIVSLFSKQLVLMLLGNNPTNLDMVVNMLTIQKYEMLFVVIVSCCEAFLSGVGKTKLNMVVNIFRTAVVRIPLMFILYYVFHFNYTLPGYLFVYSNAMGAVLILILMLGFVKKHYKNYKPNQTDELLLQTIAKE